VALGIDQGESRFTAGTVRPSCRWSLRRRHGDPGQAAYGQHSQVGKILEIHQELPGRIHVVLIRQQVGY
jgi:hypothetical protein